MTRTKYDTELISEGCRSYHKALFAVMQFRKQVQEVIGEAVAGHAGALAVALGLDESKLECNDYAIPASFRAAFDGSDAEVGVTCDHGDWALSNYVGVGDEEDPFFGAMSLAEESRFRHRDNKKINLAGICDRVLGRWIELWTKVGGCQQFLPKPRTKKLAAPLTQ
jgi:hypothetical protein